MHQQQTAFRNEQFLLFPQRFLFNQKIVCPFVNIYDIISLFAAEIEEPKIGISCKGLKKGHNCFKNSFLVTYPSCIIFLFTGFL